MYVPWKARTSVSKSKRVPSLAVALPTWNATAENPLKSLIVVGSTSRPCSVKRVNGSVTSGDPGAHTWMTWPGPSTIPPGIGSGGTGKR